MAKAVQNMWIDFSADWQLIISVFTASEIRCVFSHQICFERMSYLSFPGKEEPLKEERKYISKTL